MNSQAFLKFISAIFIFSISSLCLSQSIENLPINIEASNDLTSFSGKKGKLLSSFDGKPIVQNDNNCGITTWFHPTPDRPYLTNARVSITNKYDTNFMQFSFSSNTVLSGMFNESSRVGEAVRQINDKGQIVYTNDYDIEADSNFSIGCGSGAFPHSSKMAMYRVNYLIIDRNSISAVTTFSCGILNPQKHITTYTCQL
jgi:hypothetical protein